MHLPSFTFLTLALSLAPCLAIHNLEYSDLEELGADCNPLDTCSTGSKRSFQGSNCECDSQCQLYDDCCIDAYLRISVRPLNSITCLSDGIKNRGAYAIKKCKNGWRGDALIRQRCENLNDLSDPLIAAPVTDMENVTFKNRYCAECNGANPAHLQSWIITVSCPSLAAMNVSGNITASYVNNRLVYKSTYPHRNKWGVYYWDNEFERETFFPCDLTFWLPEYLEPSVRFCRPNLISTCAPNWRQNSVRRNCESYTAVMYVGSRAYKNPHCAICNNEEVSSLACSLGVHQRKKPPMSFTLLLDVNLNDGNRVGEVNRCSNGQSYDAFFNKCRNLVCALEGYVLRGNRCVRP